MRNYVDWIKDPDKGFHIPNRWDPIDGPQGEGKLVLMSHQEEILGHCLSFDDEGKLPYQTVIYSCTKKSGKTTIAASVGAWFGDEAVPLTEIYAMANDLEQAEGRVMRCIKFHYKKLGFLPTKARVQLPNGTFIQALAQHYKSAAGAWQALTLWDELWGYVKESSLRMWEEMTPIPTVPVSLRFIGTYAGFTNETPNLLWDLYERVVLNGEPVPELAHIVDRNDNPVCWRSKDGHIFAYWDHVPRMPWQTDEYYEEQAATLRGAAFLRFHCNQWVTTQESFIPIEYWDRAVKIGDQAGVVGPLRYLLDSPFHQYPVTIAVDAAPKHDCCVVLATYFDPKTSRVAIADCRIWQPTPENPIDLEETVEVFIRELCQVLNVQIIRYDPKQLHRSMTTLKKDGLPVEEFPQSGTGMEKAGQNLFDLMMTGRLLAYKHDTLRSHIQFAIADIKGTGMRIVKEKNARYKVDGAVTLAMSAYDVIERATMIQKEPQVIASPFGDVATIRQHGIDHEMYVEQPDGTAQKITRREFEESLPPALRSDGYSKKTIPDDWRHG